MIPDVSQEKGRTNMRAITAQQFSGYGGLKLIDVAKPPV
jgi:hypothetical protein